MEKNKMYRRLFPACLCLLLGLPLGLGVHRAWGQEKEMAAVKPGPVLVSRIQEQPGTVNSLSLDPFFLIEEYGSRARVRRVTLTLEMAQPQAPGLIDPQAPRLREICYDFLLHQENDHPGLEEKGDHKILAGLVNRYLGQEAVTAVKVDQSYLLLP